MATDLNVMGAATISLLSDTSAPFRLIARFALNAVRTMSIMLRPITPYYNNINVFDVLRAVDAGDAVVQFDTGTPFHCGVEENISDPAQLITVYCYGEPKAPSACRCRW